MNSNLEDLEWEESGDLEQLSVVRIDSSERGRDDFGSGFVIARDEQAVYVLTCAHVVRAVGGSDRVFVRGQPATVIASTSDGQAGDLAVLRIEGEGLRGLRILPLGKNGRTGRKFKSYGYSLIDPRGGIHGKNNLKGYLGVRIPIEGSHSSTYVDISVDTWELKLKLKTDDQNFLKRGHSGSPVIDNKSRNVLGIVSYREGEGRKGLAISITALEKIWTDLPPELLLLRNNLYSLDAISELLRKIFLSEDELYRYFHKLFPKAFEEELRLPVRVEYLIIYCHRSNKLEELLVTIRNSNPRTYKKFNLSINPDANLNSMKRNSIFDLIEYAEFTMRSNICWLFKRKGNNGDKSSFAEVTTVGNFPEAPEITEAKVRAWTASIKEDRSEFDIIAVSGGSVKIEVKLSSKSLDKFIDLYRRNKPLMRDLGVLYVTELLETGFNLENVKKLLEKSFNIKELTDICNESFSSIAEAIALSRNKSEAIDRLIEHAHQESRITDLLNIARRRKPMVYTKFEPYYPRRPESQARPLSRIRYIASGVMGASVAAFGFYVLFFKLGEWLPGETVGNLVRVIQILGLIALGDITGRVVLLGTGNRSGEAIGRLARTSYLVGCALCPIGMLLYLAVSRALSDSQNPIESLALFFFYLIIILFALLYTVFTSPSTLLAILTNGFGLAGGTRLAYQRAR